MEVKGEVFWSAWDGKNLSFGLPMRIENPLQFLKEQQGELNIWFKCQYKYDLDCYF